MTTDTGPYPAQYPVQFAVDYPDRQLDRLTTFFRLFVIIPIAIVLGAVAGGTWQWTVRAAPQRGAPPGRAACCSSPRC